MCTTIEQILERTRFPMIFNPANSYHGPFQTRHGAGRRSINFLNWLSVEIVIRVFLSICSVHIIQLSGISGSNRKAQHTLYHLVQTSVQCSSLLLGLDNLVHKMSSRMCHKSSSFREYGHYSKIVIHFLNKCQFLRSQSSFHSWITCSWSLVIYEIPG